MKIEEINCLISLMESSRRNLEAMGKYLTGSGNYDLDLAYDPDDPGEPRDHDPTNQSRKESLPSTRESSEEFNIRLSMKKNVRFMNKILDKFEQEIDNGTYGTHITTSAQYANILLQLHDKKIIDKETLLKKLGYSEKLELAKELAQS